MSEYKARGPLTIEEDAWRAMLAAVRAEGYAECQKDVVAWLGARYDGAFGDAAQELYYSRQGIMGGDHVGAAKKEGGR